MLNALKKNIPLALPALALLGLCVLSGCTGNSAEAAPTRQLTEVRYMVAGEQPVGLYVEMPGRVSALTVSEVRPQVSGIVKERLFEEGADVTAGQVLYRIDPELYRATYNSAKADLARLEANAVSARLLAERSETLVKTGAVSRQEYDDALASYKQAAAAVEAARQSLETARINLGYTEVTAPVSGRIGKSFVTPGALVTQNQAQPLATVQQLDTVYVDVTQSSADQIRLRRAIAAGQIHTDNPSGVRISLLLEDGSPYTRLDMDPKIEDALIKGTLMFSDVTVEQSTGVVTLRATFDNPDNMLLPGMYVRAVMQTGEIDNAVLVPQKAVQRDQRGRPFVYVLTRQAPEGAEAPASNEFYIALRTVDIDRDHQNQWLLSGGIERGELVLVDGHQKVRPGQKVTGVETDASLEARLSRPQYYAGGVDDVRLEAIHDVLGDVNDSVITR